MDCGNKHRMGAAKPVLTEQTKNQLWSMQTSIGYKLCKTSTELDIQTNRTRAVQTKTQYVQQAQNMDCADKCRILTAQIRKEC